VPSDLRVWETGPTRQGGQLVSAKCAADAQGRVVPVHLGGRQQAAEEKHAPVREQVPVQIVHQNAQPGDAVHLLKNADGVGSGEVVEKEGVRRDIKRVGVQVEIEGVARLDGHAPTHAGRQLAVEVPLRILDRPGVQVDADHVDPAPAPMTEVHKIHETVAAARPHVQDAESAMGGEDRPEHRPRGAIPAEKPVRKPQIPERLVQPGVSDGQVVHDLLCMDAMGEIGNPRGN